MQLSILLERRARRCDLSSLQNKKRMRDLIHLNPARSVSD